jgi:hypothetical protein
MNVQNRVRKLINLDIKGVISKRTVHVQCIIVKLILYSFYTNIFDFVFYFSCLNGYVEW